MSITQGSAGYRLTLGEQIVVGFQTENELLAMLPSFGAAGEWGYEVARADLLLQFIRRSRQSHSSILD